MSEYSDVVMRVVAHEALREWDVGSVCLTPVSRTENVVFRVDGDDGRSHALRIHRPGYHTLAELESEPLWTAALVDGGIGAPIAVPTRSGGHYATVGVPDTGETRQVGLIPWFEGDALDAMIAQAPDAAARAVYFTQLGELIATMHDQAAVWKAPAGFVRHALDADGFAGERPFWGRFWEIPELSDDQRRLLGEARATIHATLSDLDRSDEAYSLIHADLRSTNVLVTDGQVHVIDFDDAGFGWHVYDIAVALRDYSDDASYPATRDALLRGYRSRRAISDDRLALLPLFLAIRSLASLGWLHDRPEIEMYEFMPHLVEAACANAEELLS